MARLFDQPSSDDTTVDDYVPEPTCYFCGEPLPEGETDYCSSLCAAYAARDNNEG